MIGIFAAENLENLDRGGSIKLKSIHAIGVSGKNYKFEVGKQSPSLAIQYMAYKDTTIAEILMLESGYLVTDSSGRKFMLNHANLEAVEYVELKEVKNDGN